MLKYLKLLYSRRDRYFVHHFHHDGAELSSSSFFHRLVTVSVYWRLYLASSMYKEIQPFSHPRISEFFNIHQFAHSGLP